MAASAIPRSLRVWASHRHRAWLESSRARRCDLMVLSRAKSGRTWLRAMLSRLYQRHHGLDEAQLIEFDNFHAQDPAVPILFFTHGHYLLERFRDEAWRGSFGTRKILFLVRNPCDVAVSEYFQSTRRASDHKVELHGVDRDARLFEFVMGAPVGLPAIVDYLNAWAPVVLSHPHSLVVRYEDLRIRPEPMLASICRFLAAPFSKEAVAEAVEFASFENLKERERRNFFHNRRLAPRDPDDPDSYKVRRGKVGGYADYFDEVETAQMEALVRDRLDPFFGYFRP